MTRMFICTCAYPVGVVDVADPDRPEGGIGKEGPSAGTAILTAFVSLFTKTKVDPDVGE
jgi:hypothetical protein